MFKKLSAKQKVLFTFVAAVALVGLLLGGSIFNLIHNKLELRRLTKRREYLDTQYQQLLAEKKLLQEQDPAYMELLARTRFHMVKPGEIEFRFSNDDKH